MIPMIFVSTLLAGLVCWFLWEKSHRKTRDMPGGIHEGISLPFTQEYELYHNNLSLCSKKVRAALAELDIDYKAHPIELIETGSYENIGRDYLAVNPGGLVPTLVHNGHPVYESHAIIAYLAKQKEGAGGNTLVPANEADRAVMQTWIDRASLTGDDPTTNIKRSAANCAGLLTTPLMASALQDIPLRLIFEGLLFHRIRSRAAIFLLMKFRGLSGFTNVKPLMKVLGEARNNMALHLDALDAHLEDNGPYIIGDQLTLADISWLVILERLVEADWMEFFLGDDQHPNVQRYWQHLQQTPGYTIGILEFQSTVMDAAIHRLKSHKRNYPAFTASLEGR